MYCIIFYLYKIFTKTILVLHHSNPMMYVSYNNELILVNEYHKNPMEDKNNNIKISDRMFLVNDNLFCASGINKSLKICDTGLWKISRMFNIIKLQNKGLCLSVNNYNKKNNKIQELTVRPCSESRDQLFSTREIDSSEDIDNMFDI